MNPPPTLPPADHDPENNPVAPPKVFAVLLAAGSSIRFGTDKLETETQGLPIWRRAFQALLQAPGVDAVGIVTSAAKLESLRIAAPEAAFVIAGGDTRQESSRLGVEAVPDEFGIVLVHDAARPFLTPQTVFNVINAVKTDGAAYPAIPAVDTWRHIDENGRATLLDRSRMFAAQTPQGARRDVLLQAHRSASQTYTDEAELLAAAGVPATPVPGDPKNIKVTHPGDLTPENTEGSIPEIRTGLGYDIHSFSTEPDRPLWLGGIEFPQDRPGLEGHSDADALLHAVTDALLGAINDGDIGLHYANTDPRWKNCPSSVFLQETARRLHAQNWHIVNIDASVLAERPRIMPRRMEIQSAIAEACGIDPARVSVKATTNEKLGAIGRSEGIAAFAVATVRRA